MFESYLATTVGNGSFETKSGVVLIHSHERKDSVASAYIACIGGVLLGWPSVAADV